MIKFTKAHAYGNDFIYLRKDAVGDVRLEALARELCDRHTGIGGDGLIVFEPAPDGASMVLFNADGSRAEVSGNGVRALGAIVRGYPHALLIVDAVSALGATELRTDEWGLDAVVAGSQKAMMLPPGAALQWNAAESHGSGPHPRDDLLLRASHPGQRRQLVSDLECGEVGLELRHGAAGRAQRPYGRNGVRQCSTAVAP